MKNLLYITLILAAAAFCSCNQIKKADQNNGDVNASGVNKIAPFKVLDFDKQVLKKLEKVDGNFLYGKRWHDANGDNVLVFTSKEVFKKMKGGEEGMGNFTRYLKVYHFASADAEKYKLIRLVQDFNENPCASPPFVLEGDFYKESISVTNLDDDSFGEASFMYYFNCASEINPRTVKLMMIENGEKYSIKGTDYIAEYYSDSGKKEFGSEFTTAPESFKEYAGKTWDKYCKSNPKYTK